MNNDTPGIDGSTFKVTLSTNEFGIGSQLSTAPGVTLTVTETPKPTFSWWKRLLIKLFKIEPKANGFIYTVQINTVDASQSSKSSS